MFLAFLVAKYKFATTNLCFLQVGHTHEDVGTQSQHNQESKKQTNTPHTKKRRERGEGECVEILLSFRLQLIFIQSAPDPLPDQLFGLVLELVLRRKQFETVDEFQSRLRVALAPHFARKKDELRVERLYHIRDFSAWLAPIDITLYNAWVSRDGIDASHAFTFKHRQDLTRSESSNMTSRQRGFHGDDHDVFAVVKPYMHSPASKRPLLALPQDRANRVVARCPSVLVENEPMSEERRQELLSAADTLDQAQYSLHEAAKAFRAMVFEPEQPSVCRAPWLEAEAIAPVSVLPDTGNHMFAHLPDTSWDLLAKFHRCDVR